MSQDPARRLYRRCVDRVHSWSRPIENRPQDAILPHKLSPQSCDKIIALYGPSPTSPLKGIPSQSESISVGRDVEVANLTGARLHIAHLSTFGSLEYVRFAKRMGLRVTCEVTPHHFTLIDEDVRYDTRYKMNPPLASRKDRDALLEGLADGSVDAIATDHAPHHPASKDVEFDHAPFGVTGFETALSLGLSELVHSGRLSLMRLVELFTTGPARVLGMERKIAAGEVADLTIFSIDQPWTFRAAESLSKSRNTPFDGRAFRGAAVATIVAGRIVFRR